MIWHSQSGNFKGHLTGCTKESGLSLPDMERVAAAFGIHAITVRDNDELERAVEETLSFNGPAVCVVKSDIQQKVLPKQSNYVNDKGQMESRPMEDMVPLLDREELKGLMSDEI